MMDSGIQEQGIVPVSGAWGLPAAEPPYGHYSLGRAAARLTRWAQSQPDSWLGRRCAIALRRLVLNRRREIIDGEVLGLKVRLHPLDNVTDRQAYFLPSAFDAVEREFQDHHLPADGVYLDIGANSGLYSLWALRRLDERGTLVAVEPNPTMFRRMATNIGLNAPRARLMLYPCGIAEREGWFSLRLMENNLGGASLEARPENAGEIEVACRPLLDLVRDAGLERIDFLKIDIEGYETRALRPFFEQAGRGLWPRLVNIETPQGLDWRGLGYRIVQRTSQNTLMMLQGAGAAGWR